MENQNVTLDLTTEELQQHPDGQFTIQKHPVTVKLIEALTALGHPKPSAWIDYAHNRIMQGTAIEVVGIINDYLRRALISGELITGENTVGLRTKLYELGATQEWFNYVKTDVLSYLTQHQLPKITTTPKYMEELKAKLDASPAEEAQPSESSQNS